MAQTVEERLLAHRLGSRALRARIKAGITPAQHQAARVMERIRITGDVAEIRLGGKLGLVTLVDAEDVHLFQHGFCSLSFRRRKDGSMTGMYATARCNGRAERISRIILGLKPGDPDVDHISRNTLDNRKANLRPASHVENCWNHGLSHRNTTGVIGVSRHGKYFQANIRVEGRQKYLGRYKTIAEAAQVRDAWVAQMRPGFGATNKSLGLLPASTPNLAWPTPPPPSHFVPKTHCHRGHDKNGKSDCRVCRADRMRQARLANPQKFRARDAARYERRYAARKAKIATTRAASQKAA